VTNDVLAIYEKLDTITDTQRHHTDRLDEVSTQVRRLTAIVDRQGNRLDELATTQDEHTAQLRRLTALVERHGNRLDELTAGQEKHTETLAEHTETLAEHGTKLDRILEILERR
jgi:DNA repair exonuclease SbcCD ATPase subunit